jgi:hypothetical protein
LLLRLTAKLWSWPCLCIAVLLMCFAALPASAHPEGKQGIIGEESRQLLSRFDPSPALDPRKLRVKLAATHRMVCEDQAASANLVETNDTVLTVAHLLVRPDGTRRDVATCVFIVDRGGRTLRYPVIAESLKIGRFLGAERRVFGLLDISNDWMVLRLRRPVANIRPYALSLPIDGEPQEGKPITTVSALSDNWKSKRETTRLAERCSIRSQIGGRQRWNAIMLMDCDVGFGSSGGAVLVGVGGARPRLLGLLTDFKEEGECRAFDQSNCFTAGVMLRADLVDIVRKAAAEDMRPYLKVPKAVSRKRKRR